MRDPAKILIVDDNERNRAVLNDLVVTLGHTPMLADNGLSALARMRKEAPDLTLLDIMMSEMDGYEVLDHMKGDSNLRHLPVIVISAVDEMESVVRCIEKGADDYLVKPFNRILLEARISACLEKKRLRDQEQKLHADLATSYEALRKAEQARDALSHMIVHDLNNPLTSVLGFAELLLRHATERTGYKNSDVKHLRHIHDSSKEMSSLIQGILDVSKLETGEMSVSPEPLNAAQLLRDLSERFAVRAEQIGVRLSFVSESDDIMLQADRELLSRVLQNLLANALKHTGEGTNVTLSAKRDGNRVVLAVKDDGPGIPPEYRDKIFDKFFQVESRKKGKMYGVGLGLAFCKMAVDAQGGRIWVESIEGKGATFKLSLKAANKK